MGNAGGQDMPAVSKCCGSHSGPQVFFGVFQVVGIYPLFNWFEVLYGASYLPILAEM